MVEYQWSIFWANLEPTKGSEQAGTRPVLVISAEEVNQALPIVTVMSLTGLKPGRKVYPVEVLISPEISGLPHDSIAMAHQIRAIAKERLGERCGRIQSEELRNKVRTVIRTYLNL